MMEDSQTGEPSLESPPAAADLDGPARAAPPRLWGPAALAVRRRQARQHQARLAPRRQRWIERNRFFYDSVRRLLRFVVEPGKRVLHLRCQTGLFLETVRPRRGLGVELSRQMVEIARQQAPDLDFIQAVPEDLELEERFDYILFSDIFDTIDLQRALDRLLPLCERHTRLLIYTYNHLWEPLAKLAEKLGLRMPTRETNWFSEQDVKTLLMLSGFEWLHTYRIILVPKWIPLVSTLANRFFARLPLLRKLCLIKVVAARPLLPPRPPDEVSVSIIVPCKNERGNIAPAVRRIPDIGRHTEIIFCDDKSTDGTADAVREMQQKFPQRDIKLIEGPGICKAENVWAGFNAARGDVLMILDADLTVMPEELPYFFRALVEGKGELINGSRLIYPAPEQAMKYANMLGNKFFSSVFTFLLEQPIKDTLCGTKVLWRSDWQRLQPILHSWGVRDRWGDYELLFGAAKLNLRIVDLPVHYQERLHGTTKMVNVFRNGLRMLAFCWAAMLKLKGGY